MLYADEVYDQAKVAFFRKSKERFGGLGNMAGGYPLVVNGLQYSSSEALYQCVRYGLCPTIQREAIQRYIREASNGFTAKIAAKKYYKFTRPDWSKIRAAVMLTTLTIKTQQHWDRISKILDETGDMEIVEWSRKDPFWGAQPDGNLLVGKNVLGKLWMRVRAMGDDALISQYSTAFFPQGNDQLVDFIHY